LYAGCSEEGPNLTVVEQGIPLYFNPSVKSPIALKLPLGSRLSGLSFIKHRTRWWRIELDEGLALYARQSDLIDYPVSAVLAFVAEPRVQLHPCKSSEQRGERVYFHGDSLQVNWNIPPSNWEFIAVVEDGFVAGFLPESAVSTTRPPPPAVESMYVVVPRADLYAEPRSDARTEEWFGFGKRVQIVDEPPFTQGHFISLMEQGRLRGYLESGTVRHRPPDARLCVDLGLGFLRNLEFDQVEKYAEFALHLNKTDMEARVLSHSLRESPDYSEIRRAFLKPPMRRRTLLPEDKAYMALSGVKLRTGPSNDSDVRIELPANTQVVVAEVQEDWAWVSTRPITAPSRAFDLGSCSSFRSVPIPVRDPRRKIELPKTVSEQQRVIEVPTLSGYVPVDMLYTQPVDPRAHFANARRYLSQNLPHMALSELFRALDVWSLQEDTGSLMLEAALQERNIPLAVWAARALERLGSDTARVARPDPRPLKPDHPGIRVEAFDLVFGCRGNHLLSRINAIEFEYPDQPPPPSDTCAVVVDITEPCRVCESDYYIWGDGNDVLTDPEGLDTAFNLYEKIKEEYDLKMANLKEHFSGPHRLRIQLYNPARSAAGSKAFWLFALHLNTGGFPFDDRQFADWDSFGVWELPVPNMGPGERIELWINLEDMRYESIMWGLLRSGDPVQILPGFEKWVDKKYPPDPNGYPDPNAPCIQPIVHTMREPDLCGSCH
jgi:hypothetical protein